MPVTKQCERCALDFQPRHAGERGRKQRFCGNACKFAWQKESGPARYPPAVRKCETCGKTFRLFPNELKKGRRYCSAACKQYKAAPPITSACPTCGKVFTSRPCQPRKYCSNPCKFENQRTRPPKYDRVGGRRCSKCGEWKPPSKFGPDRRTKDGLHPRCRSCVKDALEKGMIRWRAARSEKAETNRRRARDWARAARQKDPEKFRRRDKEYRARHPERIQVIKARRRTAAGACSPSQWLAKCEFWGWRCYLCGAPLERKAVHMEHRTPVARGGSNWPANLAPACAPCNAAKSYKTEREYRELLKQAEVESAARVLVISPA